jgi:Family of unknown function (DUF6166)
MTATSTREVTFVGKSTALGAAVFVERGEYSRPLWFRERELVWGCAPDRSGSAPHAVARAILAEATGNAAIAERLSRSFAVSVVAKLPPTGFRLTQEAVLKWVDRHADSLDRIERTAAAA